MVHSIREERAPARKLQLVPGQTPSRKLSLVSRGLAKVDRPPLTLVKAETGTQAPAARASQPVKHATAVAAPDSDKVMKPAPEAPKTPSVQVAKAAAPARVAPQTVKPAARAQTAKAIVAPERSKPVVAAVPRRSDASRPTPRASKAEEKAPARAAAANESSLPKDVGPEGKLVHHTVAKGECLSNLARKYRTTIAQIVTTNKLSSSLIKPGQQLNIPVGRKLYRVVSAKPRTRRASKAETKNIVHKVRSGDCLSNIAKQYGTTVAHISSANKLTGTDLQVGQVLTFSVSAKNYRVARVSRTRSNRLSWRRPVRGRLSDRYGWRRHPVYKKRLFHAGVDVAAPRGTPIHATAAGQVTFAGWQRGYGRLVIIRHANGYSSRYGHCSTLRVKKGQYVKAGQVVARVGATGVATGNHLHFEIRRNGKTQNPLSFVRL